MLRNASGFDRILQQGLAQHQAGKLHEALRLYRQALAVSPRSVEALHLQGLALAQLEQFEEAATSFGVAAKYAPERADLPFLHGVALLRALHPEEAASAFERARALNPRDAEVHLNLGIARSKTGAADAALESFGEAISLDPNNPEAYINRAIVLCGASRFDEALADYAIAGRLNPRSVDVHKDRAQVLETLGRLEEAADSYRRAIRLAPSVAELHNNLANILRKLGHADEALRAYGTAAKLDPQRAIYRTNLATLLHELGDLDGAVQAAKDALDLDPEDVSALAQLRFLRTDICDWTDFADDVERLSRLIATDTLAVNPFPLLACIDDPETHRRAAASMLPDPGPPPAFSPRDAQARIRIGYFSADFHNHATMRLLGEVLEAHDRERFEIVAFSFGPDRSDSWRARTVAAVDRFIDVRLATDHDIAAMAREIGIDIAVDLKGFTQHHRIGIFAHRAAPIQVSYLGYPGTTGAPFIDYVIADHTTIPAEHCGDYTEKVVYLPDCYQPNARSQVISDRVFTRAEVGLPTEGFVFCCFNQVYKITPDVFGAWMGILGQVEGSVLWLWADHPTARANLRREAASRGVDPGRLVFAERMPVEDHLSRLRLGDLFLDTFPCAAHTTASDALRAGLPILTRTGRSFASRVAASLLTSIGLPELVVTSLPEYEELAVRIGRDSAYAAQLKSSVSAVLPTAALFDSTRFARALEALFASLLETSGTKPQL
jgi:predicted O-linked N-acetylglucosamine transferase (SPINDLY family)